MWKFTSRRLWMVLGVCAAVGLVGIVISSAAAVRAPDSQTLAAGKMLFEHEWQPGDALAAEGDGLGPVFNGRSCAECHFQGGVGGAGADKNNVLAFEVHPTPRTPDGVIPGVVHASAVSTDFKETVEHVKEMFPIVKKGERIIGTCSVTTRDFDPVHFNTVNPPSLFGAGIIDQISAGAVGRNRRSRSFHLVARELRGHFDATPIGRQRELQDGRMGRFGWKGQFATLEEFVAAACAVEVGLTNPLQAQDQPREHKPDGNAPLDLNRKQFRELVAFVRSLPRPEQILPTDLDALAQVKRGETLFASVGCADCHTPNLDGVEGIYSDLLLHQVASPKDAVTYGHIERDIPLPEEHPKPDEWRTPPLWGVADSAPYFHDGASPTLESAILRHGAQARRVTEKFQSLSRDEQDAVVAFLKTLRAPQSAQAVAVAVE